MRRVSPHVSPQVVEKFCPLVWEMGKRTWACAGVACPALPLLSSAGAWRFWLPVDFAAVVLEGWLAFFAACLPPSSLFSCPLFPRPPSPAGKGETKVISCKGLCPLHPQGLNPRFAAKPTEFLYLERCRQPRRGGTGGEELRRLRWSSPPGQIEQVPRELAFFAACLPCLQFIFLPPIPQPALVERSSPVGKGETKVISCKGLCPLHPRAEPGRHRSRGRIARWRRGLPCLACSPRRCCLRRGACPDVFLSMP